MSKTVLAINLGLFELSIIFSLAICETVKEEIISAAVEDWDGITLLFLILFFPSLLLFVIYQYQYFYSN